jgi:Heavy metal associated domain 2
MHIITGLLMGYLVSGKSKPRRSPLLSLIEPIKTLHVLPGRVRFGIPALVDNLEAMNLLLDKLPLIEGVEHVEVSAVSGSVLIRYSGGILTPELLFTVLIRLLGLERELERPRMPVIAKELRNIGESANRALYHKSNGLIDLWTVIVIVLLATGVKKVIASPSGALPPGLALVWMAYGSLSGGRD